MAFTLVGVGSSANDGTGDPLRTAFQTVNANFTALNNGTQPVSCTTLAASDDVNFDAGTLFVDASASKVGFGTTSPGALVTVALGSSGITSPQLFGATGLLLESNGAVYQQIIGGASSSIAIYFGDAADGDAGGLIYSNTTDAMTFRASAATRFELNATTGATGGTGSAGAGKQYVELKIGGIRYKLLHDGAI